MPVKKKVLVIGGKNLKKGQRTGWRKGILGPYTAPFGMQIDVESQGCTNSKELIDKGLAHYEEVPG